MEFTESLMLPNLSVASRDEALASIGRTVTEAGFARDDYVEGLLERESTFPTGLPLSGGVAIPHTSAEYVTGNTIAVASLTDPIPFGEMGGGPEDEVMVSTVFMLVISDGAQQVPTLSKLIKKMQSGAIVDDIRQAPDAAAMTEVIERHFES